MTHYRPDTLPRAFALAGAIAVTAAILAGVQVEADPGVVFVAATGETTAHGPVVRLPVLQVTARRPLEVVLPDLIDLAFERFAARERPRPDA